MNTFYIHKNIFLYKGKVISNKSHKHHFVEVLYSEKKELTLQIDDEIVNGYCFFINSDVKHSCLTECDEICIMNIDPESSTGFGLKSRYLNNKPYNKINNLNHVSTEKFVYYFNDIFKLVQKENIIYPLIKKAIHYLNDNISNKIYISDVANHISLSESRFQHLFKEQLNTPVSNYIQLLRVKKTIEMITEGKSLNECVLACGLTDCSHLNRVFKSMFGIAPSFFKKNSRIIQVDKF